MNSIASLTIHEAAVSMRAKKFSAFELAQVCIASARSQNIKLNSYTLITEEEAIKNAKQADKELASGRDRGALHGIPVALKDVFCTKGIRTTACSNILKNFIPPYSATTVKKLEDAGMVLLGKTNTDEFTCGASTETSCFGTSRNPWDLTRTTGGSSGGSAAAVASDSCIYALGTDTGGSIRQPAAYCGITGLKVTYGRVSRFGVISMASSLDTIGPITKDVMDAAIVLNFIAGRDEYDSTTPGNAVPDYVKSVLAGQKDYPLKGMRIGMPKEYFIPGMDKEVEHSVRAAIEEIKKLGAEVLEISLPYSKYALAVYYILCPSEVSANMARYDGIRYGPGPGREAESLYDHYMSVRAEGFGDEMKRRIMIGAYSLSSGYYDAYYLKAQKVRTLVKRDFEKAFENVDAIITPTTPSTAFKIGENSADPVKMYLEDIFTVSVNIAGIPALSIPCGFTKSKLLRAYGASAQDERGSPSLPIAMQIIGPQFGEEAILKIGAAYQSSTDWHNTPPAGGVFTN